VRILTDTTKAAEVFAGTDVAYRLARKHKLKTVWGTDIIFSPGLARRQGELLAKLERWYTPAEALVMATATNAELLALSVFLPLEDQRPHYLARSLDSWPIPNTAYSF
jgi:imidazolonepropionase-like amidohydrolase